MWICPKCGEKLEDQFDSCWKCASQPEPTTRAPLISRRGRLFFVFGILFELLLLLCCFALPDDWLVVEIRNFAVITHYPLMMFMDVLRLGESMPIAIVALLLGLVVMGAVWGSLIFLAVRLSRWIAAQLNLSRLQKLLFVSSLGLACAVGLVMLIISTRPANPTPFIPSPEVQTVVAGNNAFALDLYHMLESGPGNLFFSPYSISASLALAGAGAHGQTESQITNLLHFGETQQNLNGAFGELTARMNKIQRWHRITLKSANGIWCQQDYQFTNTYLKLAREFFSADARSVDFKNSPDAACREINRWVEQQTGHKITGVIGTEQIAQNTSLVLCDALYFKGRWQHQFKIRDTKPAPFQVATNKTLTVPMMYQEAGFRIARSDDDMVQLLELPYFGRDLSMIILLPTPTAELMDGSGHNDLADLEHNLTAENLRVWLAKLDQASPHKTAVWLPRFTIEQSFNLVPALKSLGMTSAFGDTADFSGMDSSTNLYLSDVIHKSFVEVNEAGTEATAVTLLQAQAASMAERFDADHPFIFLIRENGSGTILFLGRIIDPRG